MKKKGIVMGFCMMAIATITGCGEVGIGGNPKLIEEHKQMEQEIEQEKAEKVQQPMFLVNREQIKQKILVQMSNLIEIASGEVQKAVVLEENSGLYQIMVTDAKEEVENEENGCTNVTVYFSKDTFSKKEKQERNVLLQSLFDALQLQYDEKVIDGYFKEAIENGCLEEEVYKSCLKITILQQNNGLEFRMEPIFSHYIENFDTNRNNICMKIEKNFTVKEVEPEAGEDLIKQMEARQSVDGFFKVEIRDCAEDIADENTRTEAVYVNFDSEMLQEDSQKEEACKLIQILMETMELSYDENEVRECLQELEVIKDVKNQDEMVKSIDYKNCVSLTMYNQKGTAQIAILPMG